MSQTQVQTQSVNVDEVIDALTQQTLKKNKIQPPAWFNLQNIRTFDMLSQIASLTNEFRDLPPDVANWIIYDAHCRPFSSYGSIPAPPSVDLVKKIIGLDGYYLKLTTQKCGVDFIWHDRARNEFQFWGNYQCCVNAMKAIRSRIVKYVESCPTQAQVKTHVFDNDLHPNSAVCMEAVFELDADGELADSASKFYPETV